MPVVTQSSITRKFPAPFPAHFLPRSRHSHLRTRSGRNHLPAETDKTQASLTEGGRTTFFCFGAGSDCSAAGMDASDKRQRSLTQSRHGKEFHYNSSLDNEECCVPTQKSYSSSETLKAYEHDSRLHYAGCVADLVHCEADEFARQRNFTLAELGLCDAAAATPHPGLYCSELGPAARGYSPSVGSDADSDPEEAMSPERAVELWAGRATKSHRSSGPSSRENSALTLTDSDNDNKSENESDTIAHENPRRAALLLDAGTTASCTDNHTKL